jgi:small-conductance mechanosensitive channel
VGETLRRFWEQRGDAIILNALQIALIVALLLVARWLGARVIGVITRALTRKVEASERRQAQIRTVSALLNSVLSYVLLCRGAAERLWARWG